MRGHAFAWGGPQNPGWLINKKNWRAGELDWQLKNHIKNVMQNIKIDCNGKEMKPIAWDVVNEAIGNSGNYGFKDTAPWYPTFPNYVEKAFKYASEFDPDMPLFYNDYNIAYNKKKRDAIFNMAKDFKAKGTKIDGIGF
jgi:endo-1,4-beta-xylanase